MECVNKGVSGNKAIFEFAGQTYTTTALPPLARVSLSVGQALIASGAATPTTKTYQDQFPWTKPQK